MARPDSIFADCEIDCGPMRTFYSDSLAQTIAYEYDTVEITQVVANLYFDEMSGAMDRFVITSTLRTIVVESFAETSVEEVEPVVHAAPTALDLLLAGAAEEEPEPAMFDESWKPESKTIQRNLWRSRFI